MTESINSRLSSYFASQDCDYLSEIGLIAKSLPPVGDLTRLSIIVPVACDEKIEDVLSSIKFLIEDQTLAKENYEIIVNINCPTNDEDKKIKCRNLVYNIEGLKSKLKGGVPIGYFVREYEDISLGKIRKEMADAILLRVLDRNDDTDHGLVSVDADIKGMDRRFVQSHALNLEQSECSHGILDWDEKYFKVLPELHVGIRFMQYVQAYHRNKKNYIPAPGGNFGFRTSTYLKVGGYSNDKSFSDRIIGRKMASLDHDYHHFKFSPGAKLKVSSRRAIQAVLNRLAPIEQWENQSFEKDGAVRILSDDELNRQIQDFRQKNDIKKSVLNVLSRTIELYTKWGLTQCDKGILKALSMLKVDFAVESGTIELISIDKLMKDLEIYKSRQYA